MAVDESKLPVESKKRAVRGAKATAVKKAAAVLQIPDVSLIGDGTSIKLCVRDKKNSGSNSYSIDCGETTHVFQFNLKVENLKMVSSDYDVIISSKGMAKFTSHSRNLIYFVAIEPDSTYEAA